MITLYFVFRVQNWDIQISFEFPDIFPEYVANEAIERMI